MNTIIYDENKAKEIEVAVMREFECTLSEIIGVSDTLAKKIVVFLLFKFYGFEKRNIGHAYSMTWLYVPTVSIDLEHRFLLDSVFRMKVIKVLNASSFQFDLTELKTA